MTYNFIIEEEEYIDENKELKYKGKGYKIYDDKNNLIGSSSIKNQIAYPHELIDELINQMTLIESDKDILKALFKKDYKIKYNRSPSLKTVK